MGTTGRTTTVAVATVVALVMSGCTREYANDATPSIAAVTTTPASTTASTPPTNAGSTPAPPTSQAAATTASASTPGTPKLEINPDSEDGQVTAGQPPISLDAIRGAVDPRGESENVEALAWGDVDGDGDDDAVVLAMFCGASCGTELDLVLNEDANPVIAEYPGDGAFAPWYNGGGAAQSSVTSVSIDGSTITVVGTGLCGDVQPSETDEPGMCNYNTVRTATYQFANGAVAPVSIEPSPG